MCRGCAVAVSGGVVGVGVGVRRGRVHETEAVVGAAGGLVGPARLKLAKEPQRFLLLRGILRDGSACAVVDRGLRVRILVLLHFVLLLLLSLLRRFPLLLLPIPILHHPFFLLLNLILGILNLNLNLLLLRVVVVVVARGFGADGVRTRDVPTRINPPVHPD